MVTRDEALIQEMRNGNQQAFEQIIERYKAYVCAIILSITGNSDEVQDIAQEVFGVPEKNYSATMLPLQC